MSVRWQLLFLLAAVLTADITLVALRLLGITMGVNAVLFVIVTLLLTVPALLGISVTRRGGNGDK